LVYVYFSRFGVFRPRKIRHPGGKRGGEEEENKLTDGPVLDVQEDSDDVSDLPALAVAVTHAGVGLVRRSSGKHPADLDGAVRQDLAFVVPSKFKEPLQLRVARWYIFKPKNQIWGKF
jgi:hypothetical protein